MIWSAFFGAVVTSGVLLIVSGAVVRRRSNSDLSTVEYVRHVFLEVAGLQRKRMNLDVLDDDPSSDLEISGTELVSYQTQRRRNGLLLMVLLGASTMLFTRSVLVSLLLAPTAVPLIWWLQRASLHRDANEAREQFDLVMSRFMEVTTAVVSSGLDYQTALTEVTHEGTIDEFDYLKDALKRAENDRGRLPEAYQEIGRELGLGSLIELGDVLEQARDVGAPMEQVLRDRAAVMDERRMTFLKGQAEGQSEKMTIPLFVISFAFIIFIGYPGLSGLVK